MVGKLSELTIDTPESSHFDKGPNIYKGHSAKSSHLNKVVCILNHLIGRFNFLQLMAIFKIIMHEIWSQQFRNEDYKVI